MPRAREGIVGDSEGLKDKRGMVLREKGSVFRKWNEQFDQLPNVGTVGNAAVSCMGLETVGVNRSAEGRAICREKVFNPSIALFSSHDFLPLWKK